LSDNTIFVRPSVLLSSQQPVCEEQTEGHLVPFLAQGKGLATFNLSLQDFSYCDLVKSHNICLTFVVVLKGHWTRITEPVGGRLSYKPPVQDINAPDLYIPLMAFGTYIVVAGYALGVLGR